MSFKNKDSYKKSVALWKEVENVGGARKYVEDELKRQNVFVKRVSSNDILKMSEGDKKTYIQKLDAEAKVRKPLQEKVWRAYCSCHTVHLGQGVHWYDTLDIDKFDPEDRDKRIKNFQLPVIETIDDLCKALKLTLPELRWFCYHRDAATMLHYHMFTIPKKSGGERQIWAPLPRLKSLQKWIQENITDRFPIHGASHGFVQGRSIASNAEEHTDSKVVVSMDLKDFFPTLTFQRIKGIFRKAGYLEGIAILLALICTESPRQKVTIKGKTYYVSTGPRCLPQGSPASPSLTNIACMQLDRRLEGFARKYGWRYTRYADDLTFSYPASTEGKPRISALLGAVTKIVTDEGFSVRKDKTQVMRPGASQRVTGLLVNGDAGARTAKDVKRLLRAAIHNLKKGRPLKEDDYSIDSLRGLAAFVHMSEPDVGRRLLDELAGLG